MLTACAILFLKLSHKDKTLWRNFSEWLGGYDYVMPEERLILDDLAIALIRQHGYKDFHTISHTISSNFSKETQEGLLKWISDLKT